MNKEELVDAVSSATKLSKKDTESTINALVQSISNALSQGDKVTLVGFGTFQVRERAAREGRNPRTGATLKIESRKSPAFTAGKGLKDAISPPVAKAAKKK